MSDQATKDLLLSLTSLREKISEKAALFEDKSELVSIEQAFDRLFLGVQSGQYDKTAAQNGVDEISQRLENKSSETFSLIPSQKSRRNDVLNRNYSALAQRLLAQDRGAWDSRHLEIVQGAVSFLAQSNDPDAQTTALNLQKRMSDSVWFGQLELANRIGDIQRENETLQTDLLQIAQNIENAQKLAPRAPLPHEKILATDTLDAKKQIETAQLSAMKARMNAEFSELKASKARLDALSRQIAAQNEKNIQNQQNAIQDQTRARLLAAAQTLAQQDYERLTNICNKTIAASQSTLSNGDIHKLMNIAAHAANQTPNDITPDNVKSYADAMKSGFNDIKTPEAKQALLNIERIAYRADVLRALATPKSAAAAPQNSMPDEQQLLDARALYDQKRMQFERTNAYDASASTMLQALDYEITPPVYDIPNAHKRMMEDIKRVRQIAQSAASGDVGLYAPTAGSEQTRNVKTALQIADKTIPNATPIPTIQSQLAQRSNKLLKDIKQLAFSPSVRNDMGFTLPKQQIQNQQQPLFKRVRFSQNNREVNEMLPAIYRIAGVKTKTSNANTPLRKSLGNLDLRAANLELVQIIENQFDNRVSGRQADRISGVALDASQYKGNNENSRDRALGALSDWIDSRHDKRRMAADTQSLIQTGKMSKDTIESSLKTEASFLPAEVQRKLSPFLGFDLSQIKVYAGPIAAMASEAMGAQAFTLGKSIFLGKNKLNFSTPEGLGLLAHELLHTSHFSENGSVEAKEQQAEAMESRVKNAFGGGTATLALEKDTAKKTNASIDKMSQSRKPAPASVGARYSYNLDELFDKVTDLLCDSIIEEYRKDRERTGN